MGETSFALTVSAKVFAVVTTKAFWLTATVCTCQQQAQSRWLAYMYLHRMSFHKKIQGLALGFITVNAAKDSINIDLDSKAKSCHRASNNPR